MSTQLQPVYDSAGANAIVNQNFQAVSPAGVYGYDAFSSSGLGWAFYGGRAFGADIAPGSVALTASSTNYIVADRATGAVSASTGTSEWSDAANYMRLFSVVASAAAVFSWLDFREAYSGGSGGGGAVASVNGRTGAVVVPTCIPIACSDETTALSTGTAKVTFRMPFAMTGVTVRASLTTAQASGSLLTVDVNEAGVSILSTKLTIDNAEKTSTTAATPPVVSDSSLADDAEITIDIDQIGDGTAKGLKVYLLGVV